MIILKKIKTVLVLISVFFIHITYGQQNQLINTSLSSNHSNDSTNAEFLNDMGNKSLKTGDIQKSIDYAEQALELASQAGDSINIARSSVIIADAYQEADQYISSLSYYIRAEQEYKKLKDVENIISVYIKKGLLMKKWELFDVSLNFLKEAQKIIKDNSLNDKKQSYQLSLEIAELYFLLKDYKKSLPIYKNALQTCKEKYDYNCLHIMTKIAALYDANHNYKEALDQKLAILSAVESLNNEVKTVIALNNVGYAYEKLDDREQAVKYLRQSMDLIKKNDTQNQYDPVILINIAVLYQNLKDYNTSINYLKRALAIRKEEKNAKEMAKLNNLITKIYINSKNFYQARSYNNQAIKDAEESSYLIGLERAYQLQNELYQNLNESKKALEAYELYSTVKAEIYSRKVKYNQEITERKQEIERIENKEKFSLVDREKKQIELNQLQLEAENLRKQQALDSAKVREAELQKQRERLARIRAQQDASLAQQKATTIAREKKIQDLQKTQEIQELKEKDRQRELETLAKDKELVEKQNQLRSQELEKQKTKQLYTYIGLAFMVLFTFLILGFLNAKQKNNKKLENKNVQLLASEKETHKALDDLKNTQSQLVQSEKMASLGQLVAGVAHEVNTPLGAIKASVGTVSYSMNNTLEMLPRLYDLLDENELSLFNDLLREVFNCQEKFTSREERNFRRKLKKQIEEKGIKDPNEIAVKLVDIGIFKDIDKYMPLIQHKENTFILKCAYYIALQKKNSSNIELAVQKASKVVFALKNYSRQSHHEEIEKINLIENIETVLTLYHNQLKQGIEINKFFDEVPEIYCYPDELSQVWTNLITNASQAMNNKGKLDIIVKNNNDQEIEVSIRDYGTGIPKEIRDRIFDPFYTTKKAGEGTGLGLDIVKKIIEKHKGKITLESKENEGSTFKVIIPVGSDKQAAENGKIKREKEMA